MRLNRERGKREKARRGMTAEARPLLSPRRLNVSPSICKAADQQRGETLTRPPCYGLYHSLSRTPKGVKTIAKNLQPKRTT
ncbi:hypothetical protein E2C01_078929 [Portunus trituberculatus]|uniref:Uncharacterized protein n=1 Tax=Portunus trituberculatus TaxID=210409 RepID=A0A5B7IIB7_PORTR|nr:hypothetical protein [Portunus trituberculatus]